jgi:hypothetical protein
MLRLLAALMAFAAASPSHAEEPARPILLISPSVAKTTADDLAHDAPARGLEVAAPAPQPEPASEAALAEVRPLYENMKFGAAAAKLEAARDALIAGRGPTQGVLKALGEVEVWLGACLFLARDKKGAADHWALAQRVAPEARPDRIFPPEVHKAFAQKGPPQKPVSIAVKLAPVDARLWFDGRAGGTRLTAVPGLHYVVVERADQVPSSKIVRVTRSAPEIAVSLQESAPAGDALRQAHRRIRAATLTRDEGIGVSAALQRPLWVVSDRDDKLAASRYSAADVNRPVDEVVAPPAGLLDGLCRVERCVAPAPVVIAPVVTPTGPEAIVTAPPPPPPPKKPVWKRGWFWGVVVTGAVVVAGAATGVALGLTAARSYDVHVH